MGNTGPQGPISVFPTDPSGFPNIYLDQLPIQKTPLGPTTCRICGLRKSAVWLGILGLVLFILHVVGVEVLGSLLARKKWHELRAKKVCIWICRGRDEVCVVCASTLLVQPAATRRSERCAVGAGSYPRSPHYHLVTDNKYYHSQSQLVFVLCRNRFSSIFA